MAYVIGPNGLMAEVPDELLSSLVGDGSRGYAHVPTTSHEPEHAPEKPKAAPRKRTPRKTTAK